MVTLDRVTPPEPPWSLQFPTSASLLLALALILHPPASTAYQLHHLRLTSSSGSSCEHNGARIHLGQPYPPLCPASPSALRRCRHPSFSSYLAGTASRNNSIFLCEYNFAFNLFSPLFPSLVLSRAPGDPNSRGSPLSFSLSLSLSVSRSYPRFLVAFARVAFSTNLLRHLQPPSTEVSPSTRLFLASSSPLSVTRALSFVRSFVRTTSSPPPSSSICPASLYRPFLSSCFNHPRSQPLFWPRCRAFRLSLSFP